MPAALSANEAPYSRKNPPGDHPQRPRASQSSRPLRHSGGKGEQRPEVGAARVGDVETGTLQGREQALFDAAEKIEALEIAPFDGRDESNLQFIEHVDPITD